MSVCPAQHWESYHYNTDAGLVVVGFHTESKRIDQSQYPCCARVLITIKAPNPDGGPGQDETRVLGHMEDRLVALLDEARVPCLLLGRLTHGGTRELVFQVADYTPFRLPVGRWMGEHDDYEMSVSEHDGWDFFFESVWPSETSWMLMGDRRVVEDLVKAGSDASKPHVIEFDFRGDEDGLRQMQERLAARGYATLVLSPEKSCLIMSRSMPLNVGAIFQESLSHHADCESLGIEYDGWGAAVVA